MKILVTGKNGQIGRCLVEQLSTMPDVTLLALDRDQLEIVISLILQTLLTSIRLLLSSFRISLSMLLPILRLIKPNKSANWLMQLIVMDPL